MTQVGNSFLNLDLVIEFKIKPCISDDTILDWTVEYNDEGNFKAWTNLNVCNKKYYIVKTNKKGQK